MLKKLEALLYFSTRVSAKRTDLECRKGSEPCYHLRESRIERQILAFFWS
jgi:hypothetical protein